VRAVLICLVVFLITACESTPPRSDVILQWNQQAIGTGGPQIQRTLAMVHLAMFDAVNTITPRYTPYLTLPAPPAGVSVDAAAAGAAHGVLVRLFPDQRQVLASALTRSLADVPDGTGESDGVEYGDLVARDIYANRLADNMLAPGVPLTGGLEPGNYRSTDPEASLPINTNAPRWTPFAMESASQFRPGPPTALTSAIYARDFNEVRRLGGAGSVDRSAEQERIARWHAEPAASQWNRIARTEAARDGHDVLDHARFFTLLNLALADALTSAFDAVYAYQYWRPVTAIRNADADGNPDTTPDRVWSPALPTPLYPEYPSAQTAGQSAGARVMTSEFGRFHSFQATSSEVPASTSSYRSFDAFVDEGVRGGILGGVHFRSSAEEGVREGAKVAGWVLAHCLLPLGRPQAEITRCAHRDAVAEAATPWPVSSPASPSPATRATPRPSPSR
jgi:hypothetical protein